MKSFWEEERKKYKEYESLKEDIKVSTCIIGGGLSGLSTAYYLSKNISVAVVDKDRICSHTTGNTTGKITSQHGLFYKYLIESQGKEFAEKYFKANEQAINNIENIIKKERIDCDFERESTYVFTQKEIEVSNLKAEQRCADKIQKDISKFTKQVSLPLDIKGAVEFKNQAKFHPLKYAYGLCKSIENNNGKIYENSKATEINRKNDKYVIYVNQNKIVADYVVIATRYPIIKIPGYYFLKMYQSSSFAIVADAKQELFDGMYINCETPTLSFRTIKDGDKKLLLGVGYDYKTGTEELRDGYLELETTMRKMYPNLEILYKWSAEDCITLDKIPYIGQFSNTMPNVYVATGFNKWGITSSNIAGNIISDKIFGKKNEFESIFKSTRVEPIKNRKEVGNIIKEANKSIILSKFKKSKLNLDNIKTDEGKIVEIDNKKVGVYKAPDGQVYVVNPVCTHLGCELYFNNVEKIWECPCHGSKFTYEGKSIEPPSNKDIILW